MVVDIALSASEKIVKRNLNSEDNKKIIDEAVNSFQENN
jgi:F0F1-type ATP synthase membrane subunit b/b'